MQKSISEEDMFSAIGGLELGRQDADCGSAVLGSALAAQTPSDLLGGPPGLAAGPPAARDHVPNSRSAGSLNGGGTSGSGKGSAAPGGAMAGSPVPPLAAGASFSAGPSIGDLPQDDTPSRTLFVRNLDPFTNVGELQRAFEVGCCTAAGASKALLLSLAVLVTVKASRDVPRLCIGNHE